jgi:hypothetical protein
MISFLFLYIIKERPGPSSGPGVAAGRSGGGIGHAEAEDTVVCSVKVYRLVCSLFGSNELEI